MCAKYSQVDELFCAIKAQCFENHSKSLLFAMFLSKEKKVKSKNSKN